MKIISLSLKNFRQHRSSVLQFQEGLTAIVGPNGAGKSSIVEAIGYALYGSRAIRGRVEDLKSWNTSNADKLEVSLLFEHEGKNFRIERTLTDAELYLSGGSQPVATGNTGVVSQINTLLGMSHDEFIATFCTEQKGIEFLSGTKGAAERERFIVRMMGYDKIEKLQTSLRTKKRELKIGVQAAESALGDKSEIESRIIEEEKKEQKLLTEGEKAALALKSAEREAVKLEAEFGKLIILETEYRKCVAHLREQQIILESKTTRVSQLEGEAKKLRVGLKAELQEEQRIEAELSAVKSKLAELVLETSNLDEQIRAVENGWRENLGALTQESQAYEKRLAELKKVQDAYQKLKQESSCPTCKQELGDAFEVVVTGVKAEFVELEKQLTMLRTRIEQKQQAPQELMDLRQKKEKLLKAQQTNKVEEQQLLQRERELATLTRVVKDLGILCEEITGQQKLENESRIKLEALKFSEQEYKGKKAGFDAAARLAEVARLQHVRAESEHVTSGALLQRSRKELLQHQERSAKLEVDRKTHLLLERGDEAISDFRRHLNSALRPRLSEIAGEFLTELTEGRYTGVEIGEDFTPTVSEDGVAKNVISGGEEDLLHLCVRLSLSQMLAERSGMGFSLLILDEVFGSLDENRRNSVISLLEKLGKRFEQIVVITHVEDIKDAVENLVIVNYDDASGKMQVGQPADQALAFNL